MTSIINVMSFADRKKCINGVELERVRRSIIGHSIAIYTNRILHVWIEGSL